MHCTMVTVLRASWSWLECMLAKYQWKFTEPAAGDWIIASSHALSSCC